MSACRCVLLASMLAMLAACATSPAVPARQAVYNGEETRALTVCLAMGHTAATLAQKKLDDLPIEEARKLYEATPDEGMKRFQLATVSPSRPRLRGQRRTPVLMLNVWNACIAKVSGQP
jgi:hypothetical protein